MLEDDTDEGTVILKENAAEKLFAIPCDTIVKRRRTNNTKIPPELKAKEGLTKTFQLQFGRGQWDLIVKEIHEEAEPSNSAS